MPNRRQAGIPFILITVFLDMLGIGIVIPVLPEIVGRMTQSPDQQAFWYGSLLASYGATQFFSAPLLGALSDRVGRRPVLLISIFGLGLDFLLTALSPALWLLLAARLIGGASGASYSVAGAYLADITTPEERAKTFGLMGGVLGLGFICGPMLGGLLSRHSLQLPYFVAASLSLLNWLYGFFILPESNPKERRSAFSFAKANPFSALFALTQIHGIGSLIAIYTLTMFPVFIVQTTWVLYTTFRFKWGPFENGIFLFAVGIGAALAQAGLLRIFLNRFGEVRTVLVGLSSSSVAYVVYGLASQGWMMYAISAANVLGFLVGPALQGIISKSVDPTKQGITLGSLNSIGSVMGVIAPLVGAPILAQVSHYPPTHFLAGTTFFVCAIFQLAALVLAIRMFSSRDSRVLRLGEET
jgi:DHA1 family tetracycline resistance protein-like MFS transporter